MKLLILGFSSLSRRRIIPATKSWEVTVATRRRHALKDVQSTGVRAVLGFEEALRGDAEVVYVSTDNADHETWVMAALEAGRHVIVDKPALLSIEAAEAAVAAADRRGVCIAEATVYDRHPQIDALVELVRERPTAYLRLTAMFTIPALPADNFRNRRDRGGGAINDLGPYAASLVRRVFGREPLSTSVTRIGDAVDSGFAVLADFGARGVFTGQFGFGGEYVNRIALNTEDLQVDIDRVFTIPPDQPGVLRVRQRDVAREVVTAPCDSFSRFMVEVADKISNRTFRTFHSDLLFDARQVAALRETR